MHDIRAIRENPEPYIAGWDARGLSGAALVAQITELDAKLRAAQTAWQTAQAERNDASKKIGAAKAAGDEAEASRLMAQVETLKARLETEGEAEKAAGQAVRQKALIRQGIDRELAKRIVKEVKDGKFKVQVTVQGDELRVSGKKRDDLQAVIQHVKGLSVELPLQYVNFRD